MTIVIMIMNDKLHHCTKKLLLTTILRHCDSVFIFCFRGEFTKYFPIAGHRNQCGDIFNIKEILALSCTYLNSSVILLNC